MLCWRGRFGVWGEGIPARLSWNDAEDLGFLSTLFCISTYGLFGRKGDLRRSFAASASVNPVNSPRLGMLRFPAAAALEVLFFPVQFTYSLPWIVPVLPLSLPDTPPSNKEERSTSCLTRPRNLALPFCIRGLHFGKQRVRPRKPRWKSRRPAVYPAPSLLPGRLEGNEGLGLDAGARDNRSRGCNNDVGACSVLFLLLCERQMHKCVDDYCSTAYLQS